MTLWTFSYTDLLDAINMYHIKCGSSLPEPDDCKLWFESHLANSRSAGETPGLGVGVGVEIKIKMRSNKRTGKWHKGHILYPCRRINMTDPKCDKPLLHIQ